MITHTLKMTSPVPSMINAIPSLGGQGHGPSHSFDDAAVDDLDGCKRGPITGVTLCLDLVNHTDGGIRGSTEHHVFPIQMRSGSEGQEELGAVRVRASVGHGKHATLGVLDRESLVIEGPAVDGLRVLVL